MMALSALVFATALAVKGGWLSKVFTNWDSLVRRVETAFGEKSSSFRAAWSNRDVATALRLAALLPFYGLLKWLVDGSVISLFIVFFYVLYTSNETTALLFSAAWMLLWSSMGEEAGAIGDYKEAWGPYIDKGFGRAYGVKKGIQYGCFFGGPAALATGSWCVLLAAATFPLCYFTGSSIYKKIYGKRDWRFAEPIYGASIGVGYELANHYLQVIVY